MNVVEHEELVHLLNEVIDSVPALISYVSPDFTYKYCNHAYEEWFDLPRSEIIGKKMNEILGDDAWKIIKRHVKKALQGEPEKYQEEVVYKNAGKRWIDASYIPRFDEHRQIKGVVVLVTDISARKAAEENLRKRDEELRLFFELGPMGMLEVNPINKQFIRVNQKFCEMTGYTGSELKDLTFVKITHPDDIEDDLRLVNEMLTGQIDTFTREKRYLKKDGEVVWVSVSAKILRNEEGSPLVSIAIVEDITERRHIEEERKLARHHLEKVVAERTEELREAIEELQRSNRELEAFAYIASHDLQEPLRMVTSYVQLVEHHVKTGEMREDLDQFIYYAVDGAQRMRRLIQDLLDYSRVRSRALEIESLSMTEVLLDSMAKLKQVIEESKAHISYTSLPTLAADHFEMVQLFHHLLSNALKFRSERALRITIRASKINDDCWRFEVSDNGIGVPAEYKNKIFQIFQRLNPREKYTGTGIGLAICKRVIERHDGSIWMESNMGEGSTFIFTLPTKIPIRNIMKREAIRFSPEVI